MDEQVLEDYRSECRAASAAVAGMPLGQGLTWWFDDGSEAPYPSLREVLLHVLVETSTHAGHLDSAGSGSTAAIASSSTARTELLPVRRDRLVN